MIIHTGDLAYDDGQSQSVSRNTVFKVYGELFRAGFRSFPAAGNHEYNTPRRGAAFRSVFSLSPVTRERSGTRTTGQRAFRCPRYRG